MKVTIGLPVYNAEKYLRDCIQSILNQSYGSYKLLIIDDGSQDNSLEIINSFFDDRIEIIADGKNLGLAYRLNQLANLCTTKYLARMDADDIMHRDRIKLQMEALESYPEIDVLGTNVYVIDGYNQITGIRYRDKGEFSKVDFFIHPTIVAKTQWFRNNPYNVKLKRSQDAELWSRTKGKFNYLRLNQALLFYREESGFYYKKYWANVKSKRKILLEFALEKQYKEFFSYFFLSYFKTLIMTGLYSIAALLKIEHKLLSKRSFKIDDKRKHQGLLELKKSIISL